MTQSAPVTVQYFDLVLAIRPSSRGFGWVLFESPTKPVAWSAVHARAGREQHLLARFRRLLDQYGPSVLVLPDCNENEGHHTKRIQTLCAALQREATARGMATPVFTREAVRMAFAQFGAETRSDIARTIAARIDDFSHRLPAWKIGYSEDGRHSLFDAAALAITYFVAYDIGPN